MQWFVNAKWQPQRTVNYFEVPISCQQQALCEPRSAASLASAAVFERQVQISWQLQCFVNFEVPISWQVQRFVNLEVTKASCS